MTAQQFLAQVSKGSPPAVSLFVGPDAYLRKLCKDALVAALLPTADDRESGWSRWDLAEVSLAQVLDDACSMSLFATTRVLWVAGAEAALPRSKAKLDEVPGARELSAYLANPTPGVTIVFDCSRYEFDRDDKTKVDNLRAFYKGIAAQVDFPRFSPVAARKLAEELATERGLKIGGAELELLLDATGGDAALIAQEIEKLSLFVKPGASVKSEDVVAMVPNARSADLFGLIRSIGRGDRAESFDLLDTLIRDGVFLPLALNYLDAQFRFALSAYEAKVKGAEGIRNHFQRAGINTWPATPEQLAFTMQAFSVPRLKRGLCLLHATDKALRDTRPDDRTVMEEFVWKLTAKD
ncbi:MAG: DNA polymerase III subunit delta [Bryobacter sp.]|nr:DNA polymerase III subunit delta [Bryobacter sp.]